MMLHPPIKIAGALVLLVAAMASYAKDDSGPAQPKFSMCEGCHGIPGYRTAFPTVYNVPKLGGQHPGYIVRALQGYKNGERSHPTMRAIAADLTDADMAALAAHYGSTDAPAKASK